jgi:uncharacterized protein YeaO (DUF488 family)
LPENLPGEALEREYGTLTARIHLRRAYDAPGTVNGTRVLVDRLWSRALARVRAKIGLWLKEIASSDALRRWSGHEPMRLDEFAARYRAELKAKPAPLAELLRLCCAGSATLLFAAHDAERNNAVILRDVPREKIKDQGRMITIVTINTTNPIGMTVAMA